VPTAPIAPVEEGAFDLAAELSEAIGSERDGGASGADDGFAAVFREFKKGVSRTLDEGDHQAHYDLGIAYREMGLLGDAAAEFRVAMASPARRIDCLHMLGLCALEQGGSAAAVAHFEQALGAKEVTAEQQLAVRFELGRAFEALGDRVRARAAFEAVASVDPAFCDVEERLERLDEEPKPQAPEAAAGFESFEDLIAEGAEAPAAASESFDDVIAEANDEADEAVLLDVPIEAEPAPPPAREPAPRRPVKTGRKKKISFV
jgi:tetratricopeptide (TPR) repeat protein